MEANFMTDAHLHVAGASTEPQPYSTRRHGLTLSNCDAEPVQTPGCVQAHGALLVLRLSDLSILQVSDNCAAVLGQEAEKLLGRQVDTVIGAEARERLGDMLAQLSTDRNPLYLLTLPADDALAANDAADALDVTVHTVDGVVVLEFESTDRAGRSSPDHYALVKNAVAQLQTAGSVQQFCEVVAQEIRLLTGLDRVMVYKFHADGHGEVLAESKSAELGSWLGLHYPVEDIPKPARDIFSKTWIRPIPDMSDGLAELVPLVNPDNGKALNMTYCALRGVSLMCTEYHRNMGVKATLTLSIRRDEKLWGLIACHHYAGPKQLSYQVRAASEFLAQVFSLQHHAVEEKEHLAYRLQIEGVHQQLVTAASREGDLALVVQETPSLLAGINAGGAALFHRDRWWCVGETPGVDDLQGLGEWLKGAVLALGQKILYSTDSLVRDYPPAAAFAGVASGLLALPISRGSQSQSLLLWFRPETIRTVNWGGNPHDKSSVRGPNGPRLTPRRSFELFVESVHQRALPWNSVEIEAASRLRVLLLELVIMRTDRLVDMNAELSHTNEELDAFAYVASHDLKEPLRGIHRYAHQLLESAELLGDEDRGKLDRLMQLTSRMDSLLDSLLHFSRIGRAGSSLEAVNLGEVLAEAVELAGPQGSSSRVDLVVPRPLPTAQCHRLWCREVFINLMSNALKYTGKTVKRVEVGYIGADEIRPRPGCPSGSEAHTIYYVADNGIGIERKHYEQIFRMFKRLHGRDQYGGGIGAGLTLVRKLVERHRGQVWLDSVAGQGTTFYFTLPGGQV
jgi:chemotaxis family two-component system sensor kinase Cph1